MVNDIGYQAGQANYTWRDRSVSNIVSVFALALFSSILSPQVYLWGHGLKFQIIAFAIFVGVSLALTPKPESQVSRYLIFSTTVGFLFVATGVCRYLLDPLPIIASAEIITPLVNIALLIAVVILRVRSPRSIEKIRWGALIVLGLSLGSGIPILMENPGIARLYSGSAADAAFYTSLVPLGVANYSWYTAVACVWPVIANWLHVSSFRFLYKLLGTLAMLVSLVSILLSTLTMAIFILLIGVLIWLILLAFTGKDKPSRFMSSGILIVVIIILPFAYNIGSSLPATSYAINKGMKLIIDTAEIGPENADMTGRVLMFQETVKTFLTSPIFGVWGLEPDFFISGHSSWADILALQGLVGLALWLFFLLPCWYRGRSSLSVKNCVAGGTLGFILLSFGGVLNPTLFDTQALLLIWLYDEGIVWKKSL